MVGTVIVASTTGAVSAVEPSKVGGKEAMVIPYVCMWGDMWVAKGMKELNGQDTERSVIYICLSSYPTRSTAPPVKRFQVVGALQRKESVYPF